MMKTLKGLDELEFPAVFHKIKASNLSDAEKLAQAFRWVTDRYVEQSQREIELCRAMSDQESLVKEQIKRSMMEHVRNIFRDCYKFMIGENAWDE